MNSLAEKYSLFEILVQFLFIVYFLGLTCSNALTQMASVLLWLVALFDLGKNFKERILFFKSIPKMVWLPILVFFISGIFSILLNIEDTKLMSRSIREYRWVIHFFLLAYLFRFYFRRTWFKSIQWSYILIFIIGVYALWQCYYGIDLIAGKPDRIQGNAPPFRSIGTFSISLTFAYVYGALAVYICSQLIMNFKKLSGRRSAALFLVSLATLFSVLVSQTRGAWLALFLTIFCFFILYRPIRKFLIVYCLFLPLMYSLTPTHFKERVKSIAKVKTDESTLGRFQLWEAHIDIFKNNPIVGIGMGNHVQHMKSFFLRTGKKEIIGHAHNSYLHILSAQGLVGFIPYLLFHLVFLLISLSLIGSSNSQISNWGVSSVLINIFLNLGAMTEATFIDQEINHILVVTWALSLFFYLVERDRLIIKC